MNLQIKTKYGEYGIRERYDSQDNYSRKNSYYGNGKYPPDWEARREAVWERQRFQCGRCGVYKGDSSCNAVHHVVHLQHGGSNALDNLVGLCGNCHALMHPDVSALNGSPSEADVFPEKDSDERVAVVRKPEDNDTLKFDIKRLSEFSSPGINTNAVTSATVPTSASTASRAGQSLQQMLIDNGFVPRTTPYHRVRVQFTPSGLLSAITPRSHTVHTSSDGQAVEENETCNQGSELFYSADSSRAKIEIEEPGRETHTEYLELQDSSGSRLRVEKPMSAPPLTPLTVPEYTVGALKYFVWEPVKIGLVPGLLLVVGLSVLLEISISVGMVIFLIVLGGLLRRTPDMYKDIVRSSTCRIVDEKSS